NTCADRHSRAESFCQTDDVGLDAFMMIESEHLAGASHSALHFIDDEHNAVLVAYAAKLFYERFWSRNISTFTLHNLEHDSRDFFGWSRRLEQTILDPVDDIACDRRVVGRHLVREMSKRVRVGNVNNV